MKVKSRRPEELCEALLGRSACAVQVAAVIADEWGIFGWGWNNSGQDGFGEHAEASCVRRSNRDRFEGATIYVAARRAKSGNVITARPCPDCQRGIRGIGRVVYRDKEGWHELNIS